MHSIARPDPHTRPSVCPTSRARKVTFRLPQPLSLPRPGAPPLRPPSAAELISSPTTSFQRSHRGQLVKALRAPTSVSIKVHELRLPEVGCSPLMPPTTTRVRTAAGIHTVFRRRAAGAPYTQQDTYPFSIFPRRSWRAGRARVALGRQAGSAPAPRVDAHGCINPRFISLCFRG